MKRIILVSLGEMRTFRYFFLLNVLISSILAGVAILVMSLAIKLPDNIYKEVKNSELGSINISNICLSDIDYLICQNYIIDSYGYDMLMENYIISFTDHQKEIIATEDLDSGMQFEFYRQEKNSETLKEINQQIIKGSGWKEKDNTVTEICPLWLEDTLASKLNIDVGDTLIMQTNGDNLPLKVRGIYSDVKDDLQSSYLPIWVYQRIGKDNELNIWTHCDSSLSEFLKIIGKLKSEYFIVDSFDDTIHSMEFIVYILYVCTAILFVLALQVITSLNKVYYNRRKRFWNICYNMGLTNRDLCYMNIILSESILVLTFFIGTVLAIRLNNYFLVYMQDLFRFSTLECSISIKAILLLFLCCSILVCTLTYCSKMSKKGNHLGRSVHLLHRL